MPGCHCQCPQYVTFFAFQSLIWRLFLILFDVVRLLLFGVEAQRGSERDKWLQEPCTVERAQAVRVRFSRSDAQKRSIQNGRKALDEEVEVEWKGKKSDTGKKGCDPWCDHLLKGIVVHPLSLIIHHHLHTRLRSDTAITGEPRLEIADEENRRTKQ